MAVEFHEEFSQDRGLDLAKEMGWLLSLARSITSHAPDTEDHFADAEDLIQDVLTKLIQTGYFEKPRGDESVLYPAPSRCFNRSFISECIRNRWRDTQRNRLAEKRGGPIKSNPTDDEDQEHSLPPLYRSTEEKFISLFWVPLKKGYIDEFPNIQEYPDLEKDVTDCMRRAAESDRYLIDLRVIQSLSYREVAKKTGIPFGTIAKKLPKALASLKDCMDSKGYR